ncbi:hypothetical protein MUK42_07476 [Musa troglodytarum]|nr:hypothetical protein MUK42_07476 [Musa troglodytarum]
MCPLRFILVFLSAALAAVLAWKSIRSSPPSLVSDDSREIDTPRGDSSINARIFRAGKAIENGFWVFLDMASGRYLWRAMKESGINAQREARCTAPRKQLHGEVAFFHPETRCHHDGASRRAVAAVRGQERAGRAGRRRWRWSPVALAPAPAPATGLRHQPYVLRRPQDHEV